MTNWNGNNGNGYGQQPPQGYGQQPQQGYGGGYQDDVYGRMNNSREVTQRDPFVLPGTHRLVVLELSKWADQAKGDSVRVTFEYVSSTNPQVQIGTRCCKLWRLTKRPKFESQISDSEHFVDFVRKAKNAPPGQPIGQEIRNLCEPQRNGGQAEANAMRGTLIECNGVENQAKTYVNLYFAAVAQGPQDIAAKRAQLDSRLGGAPAPQAAPMQQAPQGGFVPQGAPMPQQGYAPQGPPPGVPVGPPPGVPMQPVQNPQGMQPGYGPQGYVHAPAQTPQAPAQGGFLAQIPGWQGQQGGNGNGQ